MFSKYGCYEWVMRPHLDLELDCSGRWLMDAYCRAQVLQVSAEGIELHVGDVSGFGHADPFLAYSHAGGDAPLDQVVSFAASSSYAWMYSSTRLRAASILSGLMSYSRTRSSSV